MEHYNALREPNIQPSVIKFDHLVNYKVIIIIFQENRGQTLKTETAVLILGMCGTNIDHVVFFSHYLGNRA